jgi:hypothetical protein
MNSYMIQYSIACANYGALQSLIVCNSNLVKNNVCTTNQNSRVMQPGGVPQTYPTLKNGDCKDCASDE